MPTTIKITELTELTTPHANSLNTVFVVVDKSSGTFTTKQLSLANLDIAIDNVAGPAFNKANTANITADAAFVKANTANVTGEAAFAKANTANVTAEAAFAKANTANVTGEAAFAKANTANVTGEAAFAKANTANITGEAAFSRANTANVTGEAAFSKANSANVLAQAAFDVANSASVGGGSAAFVKANTANVTGEAAFAKANTANVTAEAAFAKANTANVTGEAAFAKANTANVTGEAAFAKANTANVLAQAAFNQANTVYLPSVTRLDVTNSGSSAFLIDQYTGNNPTIHINAGETIAFNLNVTGHPFMIRVASSSTNYNTGLTHVSTSGTVSTNSSAQGQVTGTLYWKVPFELASNNYVYQCSVHSGMVGTIRIGEPSAVVLTKANAAFNFANTLNISVANSLIMVASAPANNKGTSGHTTGMVFLANNFFYYCTAAYDGTTNIWSKIASTDAW